MARLHALATQIGRGQELARLFTALQRRISILELAQALAEGNAPAPARDLLAAHLKTAPNNRAGWHLLTEIDVMLRGAASAPLLWEGFLKRFPDDVPALKRLAQLQINSAQHPQALRTLQRISGEDLDEVTLRQITALALQLDDLPTAVRSQLLIVQGSKQASVSDVLTLASLTRQSPDADSQTALAEAVAKLPAQAAFQKSLIIPTTSGEATSFSTAVQAK
jgi:predicted Zn-dependent protease